MHATLKSIGMSVFFQKRALLAGPRAHCLDCLLKSLVAAAVSLGQKLAVRGIALWLQALQARAMASKIEQDINLFKSGQHINLTE